MMINEKKIAFFGCKHTTMECMEYFINHLGQIDYLITISEESALKAKVAGFMNLHSFAEKNGIKIYIVEKYTLKTENDFEWIKSSGIDVAFVMGWQRLIPESILGLVKHGFFGMHGSADDLPRGRGRSPMNWALITGRNSFYTNLFKYDASIDGGGIVGTKVFEINDYDTIQTMHYKNTISMCLLLNNYLYKILMDEISFKYQDEENASYFPKRNPEDGYIDWNLDNKHLYNFTRAITKPFPGAFTYYNNIKIIIWRLAPFSCSDEYYDELPGTIVFVFSNGKFCVKTRDGVVIIHDYDIGSKINLRTGMILERKGYCKIYKEIEKRYGSYVANEEQKEITVKKMKNLYNS